MSSAAAVRKAATERECASACDRSLAAPSAPVTADAVELARLDTRRAIAAVLVRDRRRRCASFTMDAANAPTATAETRGPAMLEYAGPALSEKYRPIALRFVE